MDVLDRLETCKLCECLVTCNLNIVSVRAWNIVQFPRWHAKVRYVAFINGVIGGEWTPHLLCGHILISKLSVLD